MALTSQQSQQLYGTPAYTGWPELEASNDAKSKGLTGGSSGNYSGSLLSQMGGSIDKYVQDLVDFAGEDYNFAAKWIEDQYTKATGTDAQARKDFLKSVANSLEEKVGRIAFDTQTNQYRLQGKTDLALKRLNEDEAVMKESNATQSQLEREGQNSGLNARGIISGTRENATGLAGKEVGSLESNITKRMDSLSRAVGRNKDDILTANSQGMEDIATSGRRSVIDAGSQHDYSMENAQRTKSKAILNAEQQKKSLKDYLASLEGAIV
jgi:hypothetical protein